MKLKPELKLADKFLDLKSENIVLSHIDEEIKLREMAIEKRLKLMK